MTQAWARLAVVVSLIALPAAMLVLLVGGGQVRGCLALSGCEPAVVPGPYPFIGTMEGAIAVTALLGLAFLGANLVLVRQLARRDRRRLAGLIVALIVVTVIMTAIGFVAGLVNGHRLRAGAEGAGWFALATAAVGWWVGLVLVAWTAPHHGNGERAITEGPR